LKIAALILFAASSASMAGQCLSYRGEVTLRGTLFRRTYPEQPNYKSIAKGDAAATYFFVSPDTPFCVDAGDTKNNEPAEPHVKSVQLAFSGQQDSYGPLRQHLSKRVECHGSLYHAISGHHHSPVLLSNAKCRAA